MIKLEFTVDEVNYLLQALGSRPFAEVQGLIFKIKVDAEKQLVPTPSEAPAEEAMSAPDAPTE